MRGQRHVAALAALQLAIGQQRGAGGHVQHAARVHRHVTGAAQRDAAAVAHRQAGQAVGVPQQIGPDAARVQHHAARDVQPRLLVGGRGQRRVLEPHGQERRLIQHVAGLDQAATAGQIGLDVHIRRIQRDFAAIGAAQGRIDGDGTSGRDAQPAQREAVELVRVQEQLALVFLRQGGAQVQAVGHPLAPAPSTTSATVSPVAPAGNRSGARPCRSSAHRCRPPGRRGARRRAATGCSRPARTAARGPGACPGRCRRPDRLPARRCGSR